MPVAGTRSFGVGGGHVVGTSRIKGRINGRIEALGGMGHEGAGPEAGTLVDSIS